MNAGAYGGEIKDCIVSAKVLTKRVSALSLKRRLAAFLSKQCDSSKRLFGFRGNIFFCEGKSGRNSGRNQRVK